MSTRLREKEERLEEFLTRLAEESAAGALIVVEGRKDIAALSSLGINGRIMTAKTGGQSFLETASEIENTGVSEVILLLDFDRRGKEGTERLRQFLEKARIRVNLKFWTELLGIVGKQVKDVEGLTSYMETLKSKLTGNP